MASNRKFFQMHSTSPHEMINKVMNLFVDIDEADRFISDVPHLLKTACNCLGNQSRGLWVSRIILLIIFFKIMWST